MVISKKDLKDLLDVRADIEKITPLSYDGKNLLTRIPKKVVNMLKLKKGNKFHWLVDNKEKKITINIEV